MAFKLDLKDKLTQFAVMSAVIVLGGAWGYYDYLYRPLGEEIATLQAEQGKLENELTVVRSQVQRMEALRKELDQAQKDFAVLREMFPDEEKIPSRLQDLVAVTRRAGTMTTKFQPMPSVEKNFYVENNYKISIQGNYHAMGEMFSEIANFKYPTSLRNLSILVSPTLKEEIENAEEHGGVPNSVVTEFEFTTYTSRK